MDAVEQYMAEIAQFPLLTREEEQAAARVIAAGGETANVARERLTVHNLRLVVAIAKRYAPRLPLLDCIQAGSFGLMTAVEKFDGEKGLAFSTYATPWIHQAIQRAIANESRLIRLPVHMDEELRRSHRAANMYQAKYGVEPDDQTLANLVESSPERIGLLRWTEQQSSTVSLATPCTANDPEGLTLGDTIADDSTDSDVDDAVQRRQRSAALHRALMQLTERERAVISARFGLYGEVQTLAEIGERYGITREAIRQMEKRIMTKLQRVLYQLADEDDK